MAVFGPFGECDLAEQHRLDPVNRPKLTGTRAAHRRAAQHRLIDGERLQPVRERDGRFSS